MTVTVLPEAVESDTGTEAVAETYSPMRPISTYGASKLAGEALICSYCHMFDMNALAFRFANVVGPRQTHGVAYDFILRLLRDPSQLQILGDGSQSKSYIHVDDVLDAIFFLHDRGWQGFDVFNVATEDYVTVREIADLVVQQLGLAPTAHTSARDRHTPDALIARAVTVLVLDDPPRQFDVEHDQFGVATTEPPEVIADARAGKLSHPDQAT